VKKDERLLALITSLLDAQEPVPWAEIHDWLPDYADCNSDESALRKFERDKADLLELGVPVRYHEPDEEAAGGYRIDPEEYYLPELELDAGELALLYVAGRAAAELPEFPLRREVLFALDKLAYDRTTPQEPVTRSLALTLGPGRPGLADRLAQLAEALLGNKRVEMEYRTLGRGEVNRRAVDPYGLFLRRGDWYLVGHCHLRDARRVFRVDRISWLEVNRTAPRRADFAVPGDFDLARYSRQPTYRYPVHEAQDVELWIDPARGDLRQAFPDAAPAGRESLRLAVTNLPGLVRLLLPMRDAVEIRAPAAARAQMVAALSRVLERYSAEAVR